MIRAEVVIRQRDSENIDGDGCMREWVHESGLEMGEFGVTLAWSRDVSTFVPWSSIIRIDFSRCDCVQCRGLRAA